MFNRLRELVSIKNKDGKYVLKASEVANINKKHINTVYDSRKVDNKLDKLAIFEKIKVELDRSNEIIMRGNKEQLSIQIDSILQKDKRYCISVIEI